MLLPRDLLRRLPFGRLAGWAQAPCVYGADQESTSPHAVTEGGARGILTGTGKKTASADPADRNIVSETVSKRRISRCELYPVENDVTKIAARGIIYLQRVPGRTATHSKEFVGHEACAPLRIRCRLVANLQRRTVKLRSTNAISRVEPKHVTPLSREGPEA